MTAVPVADVTGVIRKKSLHGTSIAASKRLPASQKREQLECLFPVADRGTPVADASGSPKP